MLWPLLKLLPAPRAKLLQAGFKWSSCLYMMHEDDEFSCLESVFMGLKTHPAGINDIGYQKPLMGRREHTDGFWKIFHKSWRCLIYFIPTLRDFSSSFLPVSLKFRCSRGHIEVTLKLLNSCCSNSDEQIYRSNTYAFFDGLWNDV